MEERAESFLEDMLRRFAGKFPSTKIFSEYDRHTLPDVTPQTETDPDTLLMAWLEREEILFRTLEKHLVDERLRQGFAEDVDDFFLYHYPVEDQDGSNMHSSIILNFFSKNVVCAAQKILSSKMVLGQISFFPARRNISIFRSVRQISQCLA